MRTVQCSKIVVGFDGSPASDRALRWAAREADLLGAELTIVYVYDRHRNEFDQRPEAYAAMHPESGTPDSDGEPGITAQVAALEPGAA